MHEECGEQAGDELPWRLAPGTKVAGFIIEGLLASGSSGTVYRARRDKQRFAIKLVRSHARSHREADTLRLMRHPNVVGFHGYGFWPDDEPRFLVLALELVEGRSLDVWAREENPSALELVSHVLLPLTLTLADVHASEVVHRDIKESNIVMRQADGLPVLVDFGSAGVEGTSRLTKRLPPGTPEYRSPELLRFAREWEGDAYPLNPEDDLWALGVVTYWLLTRTLPFGDRNNPGLVRAILQEPPPPPHELNPRVPQALGALCLRMLEKKPEARYADARALAEALATEWARADKSWREPLFPRHGRHGKRHLPAAAPVRWATGPGPVAAIILATTLAMPCRLSVSTPSTQRQKSPPPPPLQQDISRQEIAPTWLTGEVVRGAGLQKSPIPAPVAQATNREETQMTKSQTLRSLAAATCIVGSPGCVSGPQQRQPPKMPECPTFSIATHRKLGLLPLTVHPIFILPYDKGFSVNREIVVSEGKVTAVTVGDWGRLPSRTPLYGELFFGADRVYGRFTRARLSGGEIMPVCLDVAVPLGQVEEGIAMNPGSTSEKAIIDNTVWALVQE